jgi:hypothetical protein
MIARRTDSRIASRIQSHRVVVGASVATLALGLAFVFVRAPHPFGWFGIDRYHDLALTMARGGGFPTTDVPWGYAAFVAAFYAVFGPHPVVPLVAQVVLNAAMPLLLFALVRADLGDRIAATAAVLVGAASFNTVYASTLSADSVCNVLFVASLVLFARGLASARPALFAASGALIAVAVQMRPNLILFPVVLAGVAAIAAPAMRSRVGSLVLYVGLVAAAIVPWTVRNWRLTGEFMPTSSHGAVQLWYGTLQTGPYLKSRAFNPRSVFEAPAFDYTSLANRPLIVTATAPCAPAGVQATLRYWTDRDSALHDGVRIDADRAGDMRFAIPGQPAPTAVYYFLEMTSAETPPRHFNTPLAGRLDPFVYFVDDRHLYDLDRHDDMLDVFDVIRALRREAWGESGGADADLRAAVESVLGPSGASQSRALVRQVRSDADEASLEMIDGSRFVVPRRWSGSITDVSVTEGLAAALSHARRTRTSLRAAPPPPAARQDDVCLVFDRVEVNDVFYRAEPQMMHRYMALAVDNIRRDPVGFALASLYRFGRVFIIEGDTDRHTAQQFTGSRSTYALARIASLAVVTFAVVGLVLAVRRRARVWLLLTPIVYLPATICFVLTNQRYSVTVQPLLFVFCAVAVVAAWDALQSSRGRASGARIG